jgi:hypothetical protein
MDPFVVRDIIKKCIDEKIKNLHPQVEEMVMNEVLNLGLTAKHKIISYIRKRLELPKMGSDKKIYWEKRGWSEEEIDLRRIKKKMPSSPMKYENWLSKINEKTGNFYTIDEAKYKVKSFRKSNSEYWIVKGYSEEESLKKVKEYQKENSDKFVNKILTNPEKYTARTQTQIGYWLKKGYSSENAKLKLVERQNTTSIESLISSYGEEVGTIRYLKNIDRLKYTSSRNYYIDKYGDVEGNEIYGKILTKRVVPNSKSSKEAYYFFIPIYKYLRKNGIEKCDIYWGVGDSNEWFINFDNNIFLYDFTIKPFNIIIEYHGITFHPKEGQTEWKSIYGDIDYESKINLDKLKETYAIKKGFKYIKVFSDEDLKNKQNEIIEYIKNIWLRK